MVLPEAFLPHDGDGVVEKLRRAGYTVEYERWVTLGFERKPHLEAPGDGWWTLAVASRLPVLARHDHPLPRTIRDRAGPRVAIRLTVSCDGQPVEAIGIHTSSKLWYRAPIVHLRGLAAQLPPFAGPAFIAGDFNMWGPVVHRIFPGYTPTVRGRTYPSHRPHSQIDHVLINEHVRCLTASVINDRHSDHRPVRARLAF
jgi:endonuclease/exonuclease/phosphatase family metal-dependent hydrolase